MKTQEQIEQWVRPNIRRLKPYSSARNEFSGEASVWLDANESPFNEPYNRYPDPLQWAVKHRLAEQRGVRPDQIFLGVGSDEAIDLLYRIFCEPGKSNAIAFTPTYGMYRVCADINGVEYREVPLQADFSLPVEALLRVADRESRLLFLCSPNNPTGNAFPEADIERLLTDFDGIVVIDEAYIDFSSHPSWLARLNEFPNLVVLQTFSKAWGSAGVRLGMAFASPQLIGYYNKVKYPYNISGPVQRYALDLLDRADEVCRWVEETLAERSRFVERLSTLPLVRRVYPSEANFVLVRVEDATALYNWLVEAGIVVRNRSSVTLCDDCLRITIGQADEMDSLWEALCRYNQNREK
ncbi:histidinol-phosphate transaminase [Barnesiella viscericola]|uniref:histidinol-phosphate transaminase n=1 Tax=Barnesiella viscericola TaxID=397865 RepID=UPI00235758EA|nr:histidinol-phosphate transaminase [Barnesiella viscericola]